MNVIVDTENLKKFVIAVLSDDEGTSREAYHELVELCFSFGSTVRDLIGQSVDATDGRYYIGKE